MPAKHTLRAYEPQSYYHIYNRGVAKLPIFLDQADKRYFLNLFTRHLDSEDGTKDSQGSPYPKFDESLELVAYCLMKNHFHLLLYVYDEPTSVTEFMRCVSTAYTMYFNRKYKRVGPLFQGRFKSSRISNDSYLMHISRYIHMNPRNYQTYTFSSLTDYLYKPRDVWLHPERILSLFEPNEYLPFLQDYEDTKRALELIKSELADY